MQNLHVDGAGRSQTSVHGASRERSKAGSEQLMVKRARWGPQGTPTDRRREKIPAQIGPGLLVHGEFQN